MHAKEMVVMIVIIWQSVYAPLQECYQIKLMYVQICVKMDLFQMSLILKPYHALVQAGAINVMHLIQQNAFPAKIQLSTLPWLIRFVGIVKQTKLLLIIFAPNVMLLVQVALEQDIINAINAFNKNIISKNIIIIFVEFVIIKMEIILKDKNAENVIVVARNVMEFTTTNAQTVISSIF